MLPPVRATLSSFVEYQNPQQQPLLRQTINNAGAVANAAANASMPISGGRLDILSLSAQLQLAQGFSIFAETIGKLVKLPRREGEALLDYARRVMEAVKAMSPAQQASLERLLNQMVKGISLRLLTEILNNPTGPDAARLAVRLETAQLLERDLAAKAVVSSYRQNDGAEPPSAAPQRPAQAPTANPSRPADATPASVGTAATNHDGIAAAPSLATETASTRNDEPAQTDENIEAGTQAADSKSADAGSAAQTAPRAATQMGSPAAAQTQVQVEPQTLMQNGETSGQTLLQSAETLAAEAEGQAALSGEPEIATAAQIAASTAEEIIVAESETAEAFAPIIDDLPEGEAGRASIDDADVWGPASTLQGDRRAPAAGFYDGPALARLSQRGLEEQPARQVANASRMGMPAMTEWLAEVFADGNTDLLEPLPATAKVPPEQQVLEELFEKDALPKAKVQLDDMSRTILQTPKAYASEEPEAPLLQTRPASASANGGSQPANITDAAEQLVLPMLLPIVPREGVALPYVAYPPEDRERDPEDRKAKAIAPTDEDGEQQHSGGDQQFAEDRSHEEQAKEEDDEASEKRAEDGGRANDLYWRMAGLE